MPYLCCFFHSDLAGEMQCFQLLVCEQECEGAFEKVDAFDEVQYIQLFHHLFSDLIELTQLFPIWLEFEKFQDGIYPLPDEIYKIIVLFNPAAILLRTVEDSCKVDFEKIAIVNADKEKEHEDSTEKSSDVRKGDIQFLKTAIDADGRWRFEELKSCIYFADFWILIFKRKPCNYSSSGYLNIGDRKDALIGGDGEVLDMDLSFCSAFRRENDVIGVFEVVGQVVVVVGVEERIDEIDGKETVSVVREVFVYLLLRCAGSKIRRVT